jgi:hypothetical protein
MLSFFAVAEIVGDFVGFGALISLTRRKKYCLLIPITENKLTNETTL